MIDFFIILTSSIIIKIQSYIEVMIRILVKFRIIDALFFTKKQNEKHENEIHCFPYLKTNIHKFMFLCE